jgi:hypothetical protein
MASPVEYFCSQYAIRRAIDKKEFKRLSLSGIHSVSFLTKMILDEGNWRTSVKYRDRPAAADIAFCVAAYANGMSEDRIERAIEDDYLSRDPNPTKRAAYIRRTMEKARRWTGQ